MLTIDWPQLADGSGPLDLDLLLATATEPSLMGGRYANPAEIASAWRSAPHEVYYFHNNRTNGITTFEDADILKLLV